MNIVADIVVLSVPFICIISYGVITIIEYETWKRVNANEKPRKVIEDGNE